MDIIHMCLKISFIPNCVFPKAPLPYIVFAFAVWSDRSTRLHQPTDEARLNQAPAIRIIRVSLGQRQNAMKVIRQDNNRLDRKRLSPADRSKRFSQQVNVTNEKIPSSVAECHREEISTSWRKVAAVIDHGGMLCRNMHYRQDPRITLCYIRATNLALPGSCSPVVLFST